MYVDRICIVPREPVDDMASVCSECRFRIDEHRTAAGFGSCHDTDRSRKVLPEDKRVPLSVKIAHIHTKPFSRDGIILIYRLKWCDSG